MNSTRLTLSASIVALAAAGLAPLAAQTATDPQSGAGSVAAEGAQQTETAASADEIVVTGVRASLRGAQDIKRNATAVVDSIVAEDIGKLPDNTVSDALQRITGIQVTRSGGEVTSVLIRGLPDVQSFINGREVFTGTSRGVSLQDIPAELVAGLDVYKTTTPDLIEGSVTGRIDIRLRRPLDFKGLQVAGSARGIYGEQIDKWSYIGSGLISNRWETGDGQEIGVLVGASYNKRRFYDQTAFNFGYQPFSNAATGNTPLLIPDTVGGLATIANRERPAFNVAVQWKPTPDLEFFADGIFTGYRNDYNVDFFVGLPKAGNVTAAAAQAGSATPETDNRPVAGAITTRDNFTITSRQAFRQKTDGYQANFGSRYTTGIALLSTEFTYSKSKVASQAFILDTSFVVPRIDYNFNNGGTPSLNFNGFDFTDSSNFNLFTLFDNADVSVSKQYAWRGDVALDVDQGPIDNIKFGARYARRTGSFGGTNGGGRGFPAGTNASRFPDFAGQAPGDFLGGSVGIDNFGVGSRDFIIDNIEQLRTLVGFPASGQLDDPARVFSLKEASYAFYGQMGFAFDVGAMPVEGVLGARIVNQVTTLNSINVTTSNPPVLTPTTRDQNTVDVLPSITIKATPIDNVVLRFVAGKSLTRPQFGQLNPATTISPQSTTGGARGSGSGGNPALSPLKSDNLDASVEWYFATAGSITAAAFYRDLKGYIISDVVTETINGALFDITRPLNAGKGVLKGVEIGYQQFFDFLPGPLSGFGMQANFTLADAKLDPRPGQTGKQQLPGVSKYSYNLVAIYEKYGLSARLAYNWRDKYTDSLNSTVPGDRIVTNSLGFLDFSASYDVTPNITLTVDATNLLEEKYQDNFGTSGFTPRDTRSYDRTFGGGVRFRF